MKEPVARAALSVRELRHTDLEAVVRIDSQHTGTEKPQYWVEVLQGFLEGKGRPGRVGLIAGDERRQLGYLLGDVRAFEFGSEACGWIFAVGVEHDQLRRKIASALLVEARRRFREFGVTRIRTMVRRNDVGVLAFFRSNGFVGGPFVQLEHDLEADS